MAAPKAIQKRSHQLQSRHDRESRIIPVATFVADLEIVAIDRDDGAVGKVAEGSGDRRDCGVIDDSQNQALGQGALSLPNQAQTGVGVDCHAVGYHLVRLRPATFGFKGVGVRRRRTESETAFDG